MTRGSKARWSAALVLAPAAAALFAGTSAWAATHNPLATSAPAAKPATTDAAALTANTTNPMATNPIATDPATQAQIDAQRALVKALQKKVAKAAAAGGQTVQAWTQSVSNGSTSGSSTSGGSTSGGSTSGGSTQTQPAPQPAPQPVVKPAPQPVPAPAPAPTTQASTGASGG